MAHALGLVPALALRSRSRDSSSSGCHRWAGSPVGIGDATTVGWVDWRRGAGGDWSPGALTWDVGASNSEGGGDWRCGVTVSRRRSGGVAFRVVWMRGAASRERQGGSRGGEETGLVDHGSHLVIGLGQRVG